MAACTSRPNSATSVDLRRDSFSAVDVKTIIGDNNYWGTEEGGRFRKEGDKNPVSKRWPPMQYEMMAQKKGYHSRVRKYSTRLVLISEYKRR